MVFLTLLHKHVMDNGDKDKCGWIFNHCSTTGVQCRVWGGNFRGGEAGSTESPVGGQ